MTFRILIAAEFEGEADRFLEVDGTVRESPSEQSTATQYPVGAGRTITDHVQTLPSLLSVDIYVTETPTRELDPPLAFDHTIVSHTRQFGDKTATTFGPSRTLEPFERARVLYESLDQIRREKRSLSVTTALKHYGRMVIVGIQAPVDGPSGGLVISVDFQEIAIAESRLETAIVVAVPRLRPTQQGGAQGAEELAENDPRRLSGLQALERTGDALANAFGFQ